MKEDWILLPGFQDSHMHPIIGGLQEVGCKLDDCKDLQEVTVRIAQYTDKFPELEWIFCSGYQDFQFPNRKPHLKYFQGMFSDKPLSIMRFDCHSYLVNEVALKKGNYSPNTPTPDGGIIEIDDDGNLSGVFHEKAMGLIRKLFPPPQLSLL